MTKGTDQLAELIAKLETATAEAREVVRELHAATKDGRAALKEAREFYDRNIDKDVRDALAPVLDKVGERITAEAEALASRMEDEVHKGINRRIESQLGYARRKGQPTTAQMLAASEIIDQVRVNKALKET